MQAPSQVAQQLSHQLRELASSLDKQGCSRIRVHPSAAEGRVKFMGLGRVPTQVPQAEEAAAALTAGGHGRCLPDGSQRNYVPQRQPGNQPLRSQNCMALQGQESGQHFRGGMYYDPKQGEGQAAGNAAEAGLGRAPSRMIPISDSATAQTQAVPLGQQLPLPRVTCAPPIEHHMGFSVQHSSRSADAVVHTVPLQQFVDFGSSGGMWPSGAHQQGAGQVVQGRNLASIRAQGFSQGRNALLDFRLSQVCMQPHSVGL